MFGAASSRPEHIFPIFSKLKKMKRYIVLIVLCLTNLYAVAQEKINIRVYDVKTNLPLEYVIVSTEKDWLATTDSSGAAEFALVGSPKRVIFTLTGYEKLDTTLISPTSSTITIFLKQIDATLDEVTIVASTRNNQAIENSPMKVEVIGATDISEEASVKPGNIASILGDVSGVQIQQSSATTGNSNVRIQGLDGRYTQILRDGMPLYDGFSGGFGILSVPPLDLKQIELIKGSASTLYGGGAIGGLINLISKRPTFQQQMDALVNYSSLKEGNINVYAAKRNKKLGYTFFAGYTNQRAIDVNIDGLSDLPKANSFMVHPKLFYYPSSTTVLSVGYSGAFDARKGGDMRVLNGMPDSIHKYYESNNTQRHTGEYLLEHSFKNNTKLTLKGNLSMFSRDNASNVVSINGNQTSYYNEVSVFVPVHKIDIVAGINAVGDKYNTTFPDSASLKVYDNFTLGIFGQCDIHIKDRTTIEAGLRFDNHSRYGLFALPRIAAFHRFNEHWAARTGFGMGYKTPNPLVQQNIEYSVLDMLPVNNTVKSEVSYGYNAEFNYKRGLAKNTSIFINQAFFMTQVDKPILFYRNSTGKIDLANASAPVTSMGFDSYVKLDINSWELYLGYTFTDARNTYLSSNNFVPLTPKHRGAFVLVKELSDRWRIGVEGSYIGQQYRYNATTTPSYFFMAAMIQRNIGKHFIIVLNGENLLDYRMSRAEPLYTGSITSPSFKPLWAPIDGRVVNLSIRWKL